MRPAPRGPPPSPGPCRRRTAGSELDVKVVVDEADQVLAAVRVLNPHRLVRLTTHSARTQVTEPALWAALLPPWTGWGSPARALRRGAIGLRGAQPTPPTPSAAAAGPVLSMTPTVHTSRHQLVASLGMQRLVTSQAVRIAPDMQVHVGPVAVCTVRRISGQRHLCRRSLRRGMAAPGARGNETRHPPRRPPGCWPARLPWPAGGAAGITYAETWGPAEWSTTTARPSRSRRRSTCWWPSRALLVPEERRRPGRRLGLGRTFPDRRHRAHANLTARARTVHAEVGSASVRLDLAPFGTSGIRWRRCALTIVRDVALAAAVSVGTMLNVLDPSDKVAPATAAGARRHRQAGLRPQRRGTPLRAGRSRSIGLIVLDVRNPFFTDVARRGGPGRRGGPHDPARQQPGGPTRRTPPTSTCSRSNG